jgi:hypothetical protein
MDEKHVPAEDKPEDGSLASELDGNGDAPACIKSKPQ